LARENGHVGQVVIDKWMADSALLQGTQARQAGLRRDGFSEKEFKLETAGRDVAVVWK